MMRNERIQNSAKSSGPLRSFLFAIAIATMGCGDAYPGGLVLVAADSAPTAYMEDGKPSGILVDVVTEAFQRTAPDAAVILNWSGSRALLREVFGMCPNLRWVHSKAAGLDTVLFAELIESPVP